MRRAIGRAIRRVAGRLALLTAAATALALVACVDAADDAPVRVVVDGTVLPSPTASPASTQAGPTATATAIATATATVEPLPFTPTPPPSTLDPEDLRGFVYPLQGACLPDSDRLMPNAPRDYRNGVHEGIDWYDLAACARLGQGTAVVAMYDGVVSRADLDYRDLTAEQLAELERRTRECACSEPDVLDTYRGRQVWIDHGNGVITRYAHLDAIAQGIYVGAEVSGGQVIAAVGESGTPESLTDPGTEFHLHSDVWVGGRFLGAGLPPAEVRALYERLFGPED